ncbi:MAG: hypothetical protein GEU28_09260 [Dehalococcoidia bacterium]|nr:hypothetical protein [Dehalococcoidia bacterium]
MLRLLALLVVFVLGGVIVAGVFLFASDIAGIDDDDANVEIIVREGPARLEEGDDRALVILGAPLVQALVVDALSDADLDFELDDIEAAFVSDGIEVSGRAAIEVQGVPLEPNFTAVLHPRASEGQIAVEVGQVTAAGATLPSIFETTLEAVVNEEIGDAVRIEGYTIDEVEVGDSELLIYLRSIAAAAQG